MLRRFILTFVAILCLAEMWVVPVEPFSQRHKGPRRRWSIAVSAPADSLRETGVGMQGARRDDRSMRSLATHRGDERRLGISVQVNKRARSLSPVFVY
jgi:hypothetical protein